MDLNKFADQDWRIFYLQMSEIEIADLKILDEKFDLKSLVEIFGLEMLWVWGMYWKMKRLQ